MTVFFHTFDCQHIHIHSVGDIDVHFCQPTPAQISLYPCVNASVPVLCVLSNAIGGTS